MEQVILYQINGRLRIMSPGWKDVLSVAKKDVPKGVPFWIAPSSVLPSDKTLRNAWELDEFAAGEPDGFGSQEDQGG